MVSIAHDVYTIDTNIVVKLVKSDAKKIWLLRETRRKRYAAVERIVGGRCESDMLLGPESCLRSEEEVSIATGLRVTVVQSNGSSLDDCLFLRREWYAAAA